MLLGPGTGFVEAKRSLVLAVVAFGVDVENVFARSRESSFPTRVSQNFPSFAV